MVFAASDFNITALFEYAGIDCSICAVLSGCIAIVAFVAIIILDVQSTELRILIELYRVCFLFC